MGLPDEYDSRFSFCCDTEGCRRRHTPPSLRFLGRRVYLGAVVVLATAMQQGATPARASRLCELIGVSPRTLARWREWWKRAFVESAFWKSGKAFFSPPADESGFPPLPARTLRPRRRGTSRRVAALREAAVHVGRLRPRPAFLRARLRPAEEGERRDGAFAVLAAPNMNEDRKRKPSVHERWAHFRFSVVGSLLASPSAHGELHTELES